MKSMSVLVCALLLVLQGCDESRRAPGNAVGESGSATEDVRDARGTARADARFVYDAVAALYAKIKMAELAVQRSRDGKIQELGRMLVEDHTASLNELKMLAQTREISVPVQEANRARRVLEKLAGRSGDAFNKAWLAEMLDRHQDDLERFDNHLQDTDDPALRDYIGKTVSTRRKHLDQLRQYEAQQRVNA